MEICDNLFQVKLNSHQIENWFPLTCDSKDPMNCGPTALALTNVKPRHEAQIYSKEIEQNGVNLIDFTEVMTNSLSRLNLKISQGHPIENIFSFIDNKLLSGNATIIAITTEKHSGKVSISTKHGKHITVLAKNNDGTVFLFDGQYNKAYMGDDLKKYLLGYGIFYSWCSNIKLKRTFKDLLNSSNIIKKKSSSSRHKKTKKNTPMLINKSSKKSKSKSSKKSKSKSSKKSISSRGSPMLISESSRGSPMLISERKSESSRGSPMLISERKSQRQRQSKSNKSSSISL